ncbi:MAG: DsbC family protein [Candidatus Competibacteraceae bacterium]|nr:DsbC family protein [Candidatus Competibacteraceae bacterium]MCP5126335.1 DsbC family protein [Gammaproteobacteria bacterium]HRX71042.1 DsbC family protein [Candidatus Competibacteraceae bacterium]
MHKTFLIITALYAASSLAAENQSSEPAAPALSVAPMALKQPDLTKLQAAVNGEQPDSVAPTAIPGLFEVILGGQVFYLSADGRFVLQGDLLELDSRANLTDRRRGELRSKAIETINEKDMVVFAPEAAVQHTVTVFTDIDCGYCRKMHSQIAAYNKEGIKIRYLMFPREGINSDSFNKAVAVWCADNRQEAMTKAKRGEEIERKTCDNPIQAQFELGQKLGVRGTPSMILEDGELIPGYVPPTQLAQLLAKGNN